MIVAIVVVLSVLLVIGLTMLGASVRVLREYERGVVFRLGRVMDLRGPGLILLVPTIDRMVRVSLRTVTLTIPPQEVITRDNIPARVTAVAYYRVVDPNKAINQVESFHSATLQIAQTTLRSVLGGVDLDHLLSERDRMNESLQQVIDAQTEPWGIKVTTVEIKDVEIPERMQHAIARQAEAERERRAKIINAEGEAQAAAKLAEAADVIGRNPTTLQLRYLQTLREIGATQNSTVVFPMPIDLVKPILDVAQQAGASSGAAPAVGAGSNSAPAVSSGSESVPAIPPAPENAVSAAPENGALETGEQRSLTAGAGASLDDSVGEQRSLTAGAGASLEDDPVEKRRAR
jgi:regulator of protease activity HflC (stomatin/prohibitin superfamily)